MGKKFIFITLGLISCIIIGTIIMALKPAPILVSRGEIESSVNKSIVILQKSGQLFAKTRRCASCHNNTLTAMTVETARLKGIPVIDSLEEQNVMAMSYTLKFANNTNLVREFINAKFIAPYVLLGLDAAKYPQDFKTDIAVDYLMNLANEQGRFESERQRPPLESGDMHLTALSIRAIQLYASDSKKKQVDAIVQKSKTWMEVSSPGQQQEICFQLLGLFWSHSDVENQKKVAEKLISMQNADGGWSQLPTMGSDAYATGQALYALSTSGIMSTQHEVYQKGMRYLLNIQDATGAWIVETRANPIQPFINSDFPPYNENQFISATATNWATMALLNALEK